MTADRDPLPPEALDEWSAALADALHLEPADIRTALVLDLARDVAHGVARPAAPLSAFLAGLAAGKAGGDAASVDAAIRTTVALAADWAER
ncbi:DUF6457 domain-containing protein [Glaciibacter flavus]|uniref:DUF6457 domain-containing protein n=1 Tax=Orlajensenia flava TaxID=2565934 RepID=UPI003B0035D2